MSAELTTADLATYRNLLAAEHLTPGPWKVEYESCDCSDYPCGHGSYVSAISAPVPTESSKERLERTGGKAEYYDFYRSEVGDFSAADWELMVAARNGLAELLAEVDRLRKENRDLDRSLDEVIGERDYAQSMADKLAAAIAPEDVLGEHSDGNFPWQNALDWATEKERAFETLRKELADTAMMRDFFQRSADHIATNRAVAEAAIAKWERGELASYEALQAVKQALTTTTSEECPR